MKSNARPFCVQILLISAVVLSLNTNWFAFTFDGLVSNIKTAKLYTSLRVDNSLRIFKLR